MSIIEVYDREIRPYLDLIDQFRSFGVQQDSIELPQICVMGDQSSGKSSVLQSISGVAFPRGSGLVTRCPTQIIMTKSHVGSKWRANVSLSGNHPNPPVSGEVGTVEQLTEIIVQLTNFLTRGKENDFSTDSIIIRISSPDSPDLTLIDLPGIVRTATAGQDASVIRQVNDLINYYISQPRTIILAVIPSNQDIATIDILERANVVDPEGIRTIGVLTKPDLIGPGGEEEVIHVLRNTRKPLALGYIMVKNLSQKEVNEGINNEQAKQLEHNFFRTHPHFSSLQPSLFGTDNLVSLLTRVLVSNIKRSLPEIKYDLEMLLEKSTFELSDLGNGIPEDPRDQQTLIMDKISHFCTALRHSCRGDYREGVLAKDANARLHIRMQGTYKDLQKQVLALKPLPGSDIEAALSKQLEVDMVGLRGRELCCFLNSQVLFANVINLVEAWRPHMENCKAEILLQTRSVTATLSMATISTFPELSSAVNGIASNLIDSMNEELSSKLEALLEREQDPFTAQDVLLNVVNKIRFQYFDQALKEFLEGIPAKGQNADTLKEAVAKKFGKWYIQHHGVDARGNIHEMVTLIQAYWDVASRRFIDNICMCLETEITTKFVQELETQCFLYGISLDQEGVLHALSEQKANALRRTQLREQAERMSKALQALRIIAPDVVSTPSKKVVPLPQFSVTETVGAALTNLATAASQALQSVYTK